ncbi:hypothetical protein [Sphingobacterium sp. G1-14]|uniref:hypothetical protein n=1 Tax=Sphingobacterium sp. G1-14 TaxID=2003121 RepID=UPI000B48E15F|nr:hypothetical protein [Sphingobacterium sp. G1-14]
MNIRGNNYEIRILLDSVSEIKVNKTIPYIGSKSYTDSFQIKNNEIILICKRSSKIKLQDIFYNNNSSLNNQIIKSLLYYYGITSSLCKILTITVSRSASKGILENYELEKDDILQVFSDNRTLLYKIDANQLDFILEETPKSYSLRNSLSHYFIGYVKDKSYVKFEKYWKSFNALYKSITGKQQDKEALRDLRAFSMTHVNKMVFSDKTTNDISKGEIKRLSIRSFILKDFPTNSKTAEFIGFINRYTDNRILDSIKDRNYGIQKDFLSIAEITSLDNHISNNTTTKNNIELTFFLTGRFGYAIRNQIFHAEKIDNEFRISRTKSIDDIDLVNKVFGAYIIDLFNLA